MTTSGDVPLTAARHFVTTHLGPTTGGPTAQLLFDSGAETSIIDEDTFLKAQAANAVTKLPNCNITLSHAGGGSLPSQGTHLVSLTLPDGHSFKAPMFRAPGPHGLIGRNIIQALGITVDPNTNNLIRNVTEPIKGTPVASCIMAIAADPPTQPQHLPALSPEPSPPQEPHITLGPVMDVYEEPLVSDPSNLFTFHPTANAHISSLSAQRVELQAFQPDGLPLNKSETFILSVAPAGGNVAVTTNSTGKCSLFFTNNSLTSQAIPVQCIAAIGCTLDEYYRDRNVTPLQQKEPLTPAQISAINHKSNTAKTIDPQISELIDKAVKDAPKHLQHRLRAILREHHQALAANKMDLGKTNMAKHTIELSDPHPVYTKQFTIPEAHREFLITNLKQWLAAGIVKKTVSKFNSPIFVVPKKDGSLRVVLDYRKLNAKTLPDRYSIKSMEACLADVGRKQSAWFSTLDLTSAFWQMALEENCQNFTAFTLPGFGQFCWTRGAMGLTGCPASFARIMDMIMEGLDNVICYIDDVLIHSRSTEEHLDHLADALFRLAKYGLKVNLAKCELLRQSVTYLGLTISHKGLQPGSHKTDVIKQCPPPTTIKQLQAFIGLSNFFRGFIKDFSIKAGPLYDLINVNSKWTGGPLPPQPMQAFRQIQHEITSLPRLGLPGPTGALHLYVDAALGDDVAPGGLGAALFQTQGKDNIMVPLGFASRRLQNSEHNYPIFNLELQAAVFGIEAFDHVLRGRSFHIYTDHKPLQTMSKLQHKTLNRLQELIGRHKCTINHIAGKKNIVADYLSRFAHLTPSTGQAAAISSTLEPLMTSACKTYIATIASLEAMCSPQEIIDAQAECSYTGPLIQALADGKIPRSPRNKALIMHKGILCIKDKDHPDSNAVILVPKSLRHRYMALAHKSVGHGGLDKTLHRITPFAFWPDIYADLKAFLPTCGPCTLKKKDPHLQPKMPIRPLPQEERPNARVHLDLYGPLLNHNNQKKFILVITDAFSKYTRLIIIPNKSEQTVATNFIANWCHIFGYPLAIVTDQGKEFTNSLLAAILKEAQVKHFTTTPYHPQANAQAEVFNRSMTRYLRAAIVDQSREFTDWEPLISMLQFQYNTSLHKAIKSTPFNVLFGFDPHVPGFEEAPGDILTSLHYTNVTKPILPPEERWTEAKDNNVKHREQTTNTTMPTNVPDFQPGDRVLLLNEHRDPKSANPKLHAQFLKAKVIAKGAIEHNYLIKLASARKATLVHASKLKLDTAPEELKHDPSFQAAHMPTIPVSDRLTRSMTRKTANLHLAAVKVRPLNLPLPGRPWNKSNLIAMFQTYAAHQLFPQFEVHSRGRITRRPRAAQPPIQDAMVPVIPEPIPDDPNWDSDASTAPGSPRTSSDEEDETILTQPFQSPHIPSPDAPIQDFQEMLNRWTNQPPPQPRRGGPFVFYDSPSSQTPQATPPSRPQHSTPQDTSYLDSSPDLSHMGAAAPPLPAARSLPTNQPVPTRSRGLLRDALGSGLQSLSESFRAFSLPPRQRPQATSTPVHRPPAPQATPSTQHPPTGHTRPAGRSQGGPPTTGIQFGAGNYQALQRPTAPPAPPSPPSVQSSPLPMDISSPITPRPGQGRARTRETPTSSPFQPWMGTPEGKRYLELKDQPIPKTTQFMDIVNDKEASYDALYTAIRQVMELPVLPKHEQELRELRHTSREALSREQTRESTKMNAMRLYIRRHVYRHNSLLHHNHLQHLAQLKEKAQLLAPSPSQ